MRRMVLVVALILAGGLVWGGPGLAAEAPRMSVEDLAARLGHSDLVVIDVRLGSSFTDSPSKIKGAVRREPGQVLDWAKDYPKDKTIVLYCS